METEKLIIGIVLAIAILTFVVLSIGAFIERDILGGLACGFAAFLIGKNIFW